MSAEVVPSPTVPERTCQSDERGHVGAIPIHGHGCRGPRAVRGVSEDGPGGLASESKVGKTRSASSVLKFDIAVLFNRHLLERLHRTFQQSDVVGSARLAIQTAARGLGASDALLLLAELATRQIFKGGGRNVGRRGGVEVACARAGERGKSGSNECAKAHEVVKRGLRRPGHLHAATYGASSPRRRHGRAWRRWRFRRGR